MNSDKRFKKLNKVSLFLLIISLVLITSIYVFDFPYDSIPPYMACILGFSFGLFIGLNITLFFPRSPQERAGERPPPTSHRF
jgi:hypothetical protein